MRSREMLYRFRYLATSQLARFNGVALYTDQGQKIPSPQGHYEYWRRYLPPTSLMQ